MSPIEELVWKMIRQTRILLVEDCPGSLSSLSSILNSEYDCQTTVLDSGSDFASVAQGDRFDIAFVSAGAAGMTVANAVIRALRRCTPGVPIVLVVPRGYSAAGLNDQSVEPGFVGLLQAPYGHEHVQEVFVALRIPARMRGLTTGMLRIASAAAA